MIFELCLFREHKLSSFENNNSSSTIVHFGPVQQSQLLFMPAMCTVSQNADQSR